VDEAWDHPDGVLARCVERIVDNAAERAQSLTSYRPVRAHPVLVQWRTAVSIVRDRSIECSDLPGPAVMMAR